MNFKNIFVQEYIYFYSQNEVNLIYQVHLATAATNYASHGTRTRVDPRGELADGEARGPLGLAPSLPGSVQ